jgi:hypothetical protein
MIGVDKIGEIRRAYFEQHRSIKEIVRTLSVSRATVRKVVRGHQTELRGRGYDGAYDSVHRFVKAWRDERARVPVHAYVPMSFAPGEAYQFDWSHETITLAGLPLTVKAR